ncbi:MAG: HPr family phosphocarrier protein [Sulfurovum sp.]|nr:MAG: HPr family phosphocarrier protein [Sulfurovum sp.]
MKFFKNLFSKPHKTILTVTSNSGFHLRPIAVFVSKAKSFDCVIKASFKHQTVDTKSVNALLALNLDKGDSFTLIAKGSSAKEALNVLSKTFHTLMQNDEPIKHIQKKEHHYLGACLYGESIYEGIAIAPLFTHEQTEHYEEIKTTFIEAITYATNDLEKLYSTDKSSNENTMIYMAQKELLASLAKEEGTFENFEQRIYKEIEALEGGKLESKRVDYLDILQRVKSYLGYSTNLSFPKEAFILIAKDLLPSDILALENTQVAGVILKESTLTSHTAILLRAAGIPSLILTQDISKYPHTRVILDTYSGLLLISPSEADLQEAKTIQKQYQNQISKAYEKRFEKAYTKKGKYIKVSANISDLRSAEIAKKEGADGIGLFRTEFLFKEQKPDFQLQVDTYRKIFDLFPSATVRTLDVGGDKFLPYIQLPHEHNPFLGIRGIRLFQTHPKLIKEQLLAILTAANGKKIKIMFPMISCVSEFIEIKKIAQTLAKENNINISHISFGIMIEVPSTLFLLESFNKEVDFYSIGTNDLTQYLFAIERTHTTLTTNPLSPAIFHALDFIMHHATKPVSICGELASNKQAIPKLLDLGLERLSVSPKHIAQTKEEIRDV